MAKLGVLLNGANRPVDPKGGSIAGFKTERKSSHASAAKFGLDRNGDIDSS